MTEASWTLLRTLTLLQSESATVNAEIQPLLKLSDITRIISTTVVHSIKQAAAYHITALVTALVTVLLAIRHPRRRWRRRIKTKRPTMRPEALKVTRIRGGMPAAVTSTPPSRTTSAQHPTPPPSMKMLDEAAPAEASNKERFLAFSSAHSRPLAPCG